MDELSVRNIVWAYANGIFPMGRAADSRRIDWYDPDPRGVLPLDGFRVPRSLRKTLRKAPFEVRIDADFDAVVAGCAGRESTWINGAIRRVYGELHAAGLAHSVECWRGGELVGGLYGVHLKAAFFGESMFSRRELGGDNSSKLCLLELERRLLAGGYTLLDSQEANDHMSQFGGEEISFDEYLTRLHSAIEIECKF